MPRHTDLSPLSQLMRRIDAVADGAPPPDTVSTGFPSVDRLLGGGVRRGDLVVIGGGVGSGKSAFGLGVALRGAQEEQRVAFFTAETSVERVYERALAIEGRVTIDDIRNGRLDDRTRASIGGVAIRLRDAPIVIERIAGGGAEALADELRRTLDIHLAVVDPLQALATGARTQDEELAAAVRQLKVLAVEMDLALVLTAHLPDHSPDRENRRPTLEDFGVLGAVKQHADVVLGLYREEMYEPGHGVEGATELIALKNRGGPTGYVDLYFYKQWMRFEDMLDPDR
jgi:replicative DNA helicase